jgi:hypothetical protein
MPLSSFVYFVFCIYGTEALLDPVCNCVFCRQFGRTSSTWVVGVSYRMRKSRSNFEVLHPRCVYQLYDQKNVLNIWSEYNFIFLHRILHTTTCFGPVYWPSSDCIINLISRCTICTWVTLVGTRSRLTVVCGMASGSPWTGVNIIRQ